MRRRKILVATDFSAKSQVGAREALALAAKMGFELIVMHVIRDPWNEIPEREKESLRSLSAAELMRKADEICQEKLRKILAEAKDIPEDRKSFVVRVGDPGDRILEFIDRNDIDIVVLGDLGRSAFTNQLLGSVAEKVVHRAPCSVLIAKRIIDE